ncbi:WD40/YVTN/BNR-like repeat-containing protein [Vibrio sp. DNB22_12_1]
MKKMATTPIAIALSLIMATAGTIAFAPRITEPLAATEIPVKNMIITSVAQSKLGLIAAGELGHILLSQDNGQTWNKANINTQRHALITDLTFQTESYGLAIGHEGWILQTQDGGANWNEVSFGSEHSVPLLNISQVTKNQWATIGAYGLTRISNDNGNTWQDVPPPAQTDWHLNAMIVPKEGKTRLIAGEAGTVLRSEDNGQSWQSITPFYDGSFYGGIHLGNQSWLIYGMRGNIFRSFDDGISWQKADFNLPISLFAHLQLPDGQIMLGGQGGLLLSSTDNGERFNLLRRGGRETITDIHLLDSGDLLLGSDAGVIHFPVSDAKEIAYKSTIINK